jgi:hypothetical protein
MTKPEILAKVASMQERIVAKLMPFENEEQDETRHNLLMEMLEMFQQLVDAQPGDIPDARPLTKAKRRNVWDRAAQDRPGVPEGKGRMVNGQLTFPP